MALATPDPARPPLVGPRLMNVLTGFWAGLIVTGLFSAINQKQIHSRPPAILDMMGTNWYGAATIAVQVAVGLIICLCLWMFFRANWDDYVGVWNAITVSIDVPLICLATYAAFLAGNDIERFRFCLFGCAFLWLIRCAAGYWIARTRGVEATRTLFTNLLIRYGLWWSVLATFPAMYQIGERAFPAWFKDNNSPAILEFALLFGPLIICIWGLWGGKPLKEFVGMFGRPRSTGPSAGA